MKSLGSFLLVGLAVLGVALVVIAVILKADAEEGEEGTEDLKGVGASHPDGEVLMLRFREMFDYEAPAPVGEGAGGRGITPIIVSSPNARPIDLAELLTLAEKLNRSVENLADGSTQVEQSVAWFLYEGRLHYIILLRPFERVAHELMKRRGEGLFISFLDEDGKRLVPPSAPEEIATRNLRVAVMGAKRVPAGWVTYGELPLQGAIGEDLEKPKVGWIFSSNLHARLRQLRRDGILQDGVVHDPFRLDFEAKGTRARE